ncbi:DNA-binding protein HU-beta [Sphingobium sp. AP50]|jgi:DNA-binding protein HU-beta|uniref:HU family DNA-binding protein n=1 Tax=Sphingobium sp. AP50 TaxID=1884369 RepID=UPI0008B3F857|nr:HU family DNA-binding protein [Sphingobium sp. AP50]SEJ46287.1 DNA-binding protein HU-beta [Sphingobium sp. AP50]
MNTTELVDAVATQQGIAKSDAKKILDGLIAAIMESAAKGEEISLNGFGKFKIKDSPARDGRNPATGETISIAASRKLTFTPAKAVKDKLNG